MPRGSTPATGRPGEGRVRAPACSWYPAGIERLHQPVQGFGYGFTVLHQRQPDIAVAGIAAVGLLPRQVAARQHTHAGLLVKFHRHGLVAAKCGYVEPDAKTAGRAVVAIAVAEDLVGQIEFHAVQPAVLLDMRLVAVGGDRDLL